MGSVVPMPLGFEGGGLRLVAEAVVVPALASQIYPALVLPEREARDIVTAVSQADARRGGRFTSGLAGTQVWSGAFDGPDGTRGNAVQLGTVDWAHDTPARHYVTVIRSAVTAAGVAAGESPASILYAVLALTGMSLEAERLRPPVTPARDPFRHPR
jgi:hypothetical protein